MNSDNPFAKNNSLNIGKDISWKIDKKAVLATKSTADDKGTYYHLQFDNKQLTLVISGDAAGAVPKKFGQLEIKNVKINGKQSRLFKWCLNNQERHNRFLQQGLKVKKNICTINGNAGSFKMRLNKDTLTSLQNGSRLSIMVKPFRIPLDLNYDISDFGDMYIALNAKPAPVVPVVLAAPVINVVENKKPTKKSSKKISKKCLARPPAKYKAIKSVEYKCSNAAAKKGAEARMTKLVNQEKAKQQKLAAEKTIERERQQKLAAEKKQKVLAAKSQQQEVLQAEAAAIAASEAKQAKIGDEITQKMVKVCEKYWSKGEHRCYCQKFIEHAPSSIQESSTCE